VTTQPGVFLFSLDTELAWGHFDCFDPALFSSDGSRERRAVERLLHLFAEYGITATWCVVGQMFHRDDGDHYPAFWRGKYPLFEQMYDERHPLLHGADVVERLIADGRHEIGCHGYTHRPFHPQWMTPEDARWELEQWRAAAESWGIRAQTIIFPRNRVGFLDIIHEYGVSTYRGLEVQPATHRLPGIGKVFRRFNETSGVVLPPAAYPLPAVEPNGMVNLPASRWLFGVSPAFDAGLERVGLTELRAQTLVRGVRRAAREGKIIHLWAHPYEFRTDAEFDKLARVLRQVRHEAEAGRLHSMSMNQLSQTILRNAS
jgi:hypothetical protein